jgi:hypothetical protein
MSDEALVFFTDLNFSVTTPISSVLGLEHSRKLQWTAPFDGFGRQSKQARSQAHVVPNGYVATLAKLLMPHRRFLHSSFTIDWVVDFTQSW